jgi:hypothetical protein
MRVTSTFFQIGEMSRLDCEDAKNKVVVVKMRKRVGMVNSWKKRS